MKRKKTALNSRIWVISSLIASGLRTDQPLKKGPLQNGGQCRGLKYQPINQRVTAGLKTTDKRGGVCHSDTFTLLELGTKPLIHASSRFISLINICQNLYLIQYKATGHCNHTMENLDFGVSVTWIHIVPGKSWADCLKTLLFLAKYKLENLRKMPGTQEFQMTIMCGVSHLMSWEVVFSTGH